MSPLRIALSDDRRPGRAGLSCLLWARDPEKDAVRFRLDLGSVLAIARHQSVVIAFGVALLVYFLYHVTRFHPSTLWPLRPIGDASIMFDRSQDILAQSDYPARLDRGNLNLLFPYPPSAVLLFGALGIAGPALFM